MTATSGARIHAFDWLRGVAVLVMIQTHTQVLLLPGLITTPFGWQLVRIDGLVAPSFIFSAGFALALVQVRAGLAGRRQAQAKKTLKRIGEVLLVASFINFIWFPVLREPKWLLRIDILHCIGLSLLIAMPFLVGLSTRPQVLRWLMLGLAALVFGVSPLLEDVTGIAQLFLTPKPGVLDATTGATFPLLPWAGYVFLGASFGATVAMMKSEAQLWRWLGLLVGVGALLWWQEDAVKAAYPPHNFWLTNPANAAQRWTLVLSLVGVFRLIERRFPRSVDSRLAKLIGRFGGWSLSAYFFHEMLLYQRHVGVFTRFFREKADWPLYWALTLALIFLTWLCCRIWDVVDPKLRALLSKKPAPAPG
ncbi:MAG: heparan-alpha-glucosaminide N-acetyltransferase domain-containing protein [Myxococcota bacterium]